MSQFSQNLELARRNYFFYAPPLALFAFLTYTRFSPAIGGLALLLLLAASVNKLIGLRAKRRG